MDKDVLWKNTKNNFVQLLLKPWNCLQRNDTRNSPYISVFQPHAYTNAKIP